MMWVFDDNKWFHEAVLSVDPLNGCDNSHGPGNVYHFLWPPSHLGIPNDQTRQWCNQSVCSIPYTCRDSIDYQATYWISSVFWMNYRLSFWLDLCTGPRTYLQRYAQPWTWSCWISVFSIKTISWILGFPFLESTISFFALLTLRARLLFCNL